MFEYPGSVSRDPVLYTGAGFESPNFSMASVARSPLSEDVVPPYDPRAINAAQQVMEPTILQPPSKSTGVPVTNGKISPWFDRNYNESGEPVHEWYCYIYPSDYVNPQVRAFGRLEKLHLTLVDSQDLGLNMRNIYLVFSIGSQIKASSAKPLIPTPVWNERISLEVDSSPEMRIQLLDADTREALGLGVVPLDVEFLQELNTGPKERWIPLALKDGRNGLIRLFLHGEFAELGPLRNVHVTVVEGQELAGGPQDLYLILTSEGKPKATTAKPAVAPVWNEEFLFPVTSDLQIRCQDAKNQQTEAWGLGRLLFNQTLISEVEQGKVEKWVQIKKANGMSGRVLLSLERGPDDEISRSLTSLATGDLQKVVITVIDGKNLQDMDAMSKSDPFVCVKVGEQNQNTTVKNNTLSPTWNETFTFDVKTSQEIYLSLFDKDYKKKNDPMGNGSIVLNEELVQQLREGPVDRKVDLILKGKNAGFLRTRLQGQFGSKLGKLSDFSLLKVTIGDTRNVFSGPQAPAAGYLIATVGSQTKPTTAKIVSAETSWNETLDFESLDGDSIKLRAQDGTQREQPAWGTGILSLDPQLLGELHQGKVERWLPIQRRDNQSGMLRVYIQGITNRSRDLSPFMEKLKITAVSAKDLLKMDASGKSDPLAEIKFGAETHRTNFKRNNLNPVWNESFFFPGCDATEVGVKLFDQDKNSVTLMGESVLKLSIGLINDLKHGPIKQKLELNHEGKNAGTFDMILEAQFTGGRKLAEGKRYAVMVGEGQNLFGDSNGLIHLDCLGSLSSAKSKAPTIVWDETLMVDVEGDLELLAFDSNMPANAWAKGSLSFDNNLLHEMQKKPAERWITMQRNDGQEGKIKVTLKPLKNIAKELDVLNVTVLDAKGLVGSRKEKSEPFLQLKMGPQTKNTASKSGQSPVWNERFAFFARGTSDLNLHMFDNKTSMGNALCVLDPFLIKKLQKQQVEQTIKLNLADKEAGSVRLMLEGKFRDRESLRSQPLGKISVIIAEGQDIGGSGTPDEMYMIATIGENSKATSTLESKRVQAWGEVLEFDVNETEDLLKFRAQNSKKRNADAWALGQLPLDDGLVRGLANGPVEKWVPLRRRDGRIGMLKVILESQGVLESRSISQEKLSVTVNEGRDLSGGWPPANEVYLAVNIGKDIKATTSKPAGTSQLWDELLKFEVQGQPDIRVQVVDTDLRETLGVGTLPLRWSELKQGPVQSWMEIAMKDGRTGHVRIGLASGDDEEALLRRQEEERRNAEEKQRRNAEEEAKRRAEEEEEEAQRRIREEDERRRLEEERRQQEEKALKPKTRGKKGSSKAKASAPKKSSAKLGSKSAVKIQTRPWVGLEIKLLDDDLGQSNCVVVIHSITPESPAQKAGLLEEDIIETWNGTPLRSKADWDNQVKSSTIGSKVELNIIRNGTSMVIPAIIGSTQRMLGGKRKVTTKKTARKSSRAIPKKGAKKKSSKKSPKKSPKKKSSKKSSKKSPKKKKGGKKSKKGGKKKSKKA